MLVYDDTNQEKPLSIYNKGIDRQTLSYYDKGIIYPNISREEPLKIECQHFIDCIQKNKTPLTNGKRGIKVLKILEAIQKSLDSNGHLIEISD